ncbi:hypothetical protein HJFPF1_07643 [Paramyrothecium foliicola]|nr:hypothetical protein HJFPF1_07643 [Paramyrothecium foliicola]
MSIFKKFVPENPRQSYLTASTLIVDVPSQAHPFKWCSTIRHTITIPAHDYLMHNCKHETKGPVQRATEGLVKWLNEELVLVVASMKP